MAETSKLDSHGNADNVMRSIYNPENKSITVDGFVTAKIGHKITKASVNSTTEDISFLDGSTVLYTLRIIYTSSTKEDFLSIERIV